MDGCFKKCEDKFADYQKELIKKGISFCNATWDHMICWPTTLTNKTIPMGCPDNFIIIDPTKSTYMECGTNATWVPRRSVDDCLYEDYIKRSMEAKSKPMATPEQEQFLEKVAGIGRFLELFCTCLSVFSLIVALFVLNHFSALKCHRTRIHKHLFGALIIFGIIQTITVVDDSISFWQKDMCSIISTNTIMSTPILCETLIVLREYSRFVFFAWMFIEGYYLNGLVSAAVFGSPKFILYYIVGWVSPLPFVILWIVVMSTSNVLPCWFSYEKSVYYNIVEVPRLTMMAIDIILLINIIRVLVTKLRQNNSSESQLVRKAIKATAVLTPLLGVCNLMYLVNPTTDALQPKAKIVLTVCILKLPPNIQGFIVALLYCFLNGEVMTVLRRRWSSWRLRRISGNNTTIRRTSASVFTTVTDVRMTTIKDDGELEKLDESLHSVPKVHVADEDVDQKTKLNGHV